ncbi:protein FAR1-RELATED SEQUENCE 5-like [Aristolochia californica]|uniref:protein FAR1-RELATED SEQUENCE 5-like n=1 Tax=Aristolochia californica TaxID=171875 RepID=UPI0035DCCEFC
MAVERTDCCIPMDLESTVSDCTKDVSSTVNDAVAVLDAFYVNGNALENNPLLEPCMGMKFESEKALFSFYQDYAIRLGFSITISSRRRSRTNSTIIAGVYACSRYGYKKPSERKYRPRPTFKTGCKAMIKAERMETGTWTILEVVKDHNHELDPDNVRVHAFTYEDEGNSGVRNLAAMENSEPSLGGDGIEGIGREIITTGVLES